MEFYFETNDVSTVDDRALVIFSSDAKMTAIAKREQLAHNDNGVLSSNGDEMLSACYTFVERWIPFENIDLSFELRTIRPGSMDLVSLKHGGYIRLSSDTIILHLVTEAGEVTSELSGSWDLIGWKTIRVQRTHERISIGIGDNIMHIDIPDNCRDGLEMIGLFGEVFNMEFEVASVLIEELT